MRRHPLDLISLTAGLLLLVLAAAAMLDVLAPDLPWPALAAAAGLVLLGGMGVGAAWLKAER
jgi:hypothetical protein